jgi:hypothetical protein
MEVKRECDKHVVHHFSIWQLQTHLAVLQSSKKSRMRMKVPSTITLSFPTLLSLLTTGKNKVGYFLDRVVNVFLHCLTQYPYEETHTYVQDLTDILQFVISS